jgi:hypothetical protein
VQVLNAEELDELVKSWRLIKSVVKKLDCAGFECRGAG